MRKIYFLPLLFLCYSAAYSQINLTAENTAAIYEPGNNQNFYYEFATTMVDIGQPAGGNSFDFSNLDLPLAFEVTALIVADTPLAEDYPEADLCLSTSATFNNIVITTYQYFANDQSFDQVAVATSFSNLPDPDLVTFDPPLTILNYPASFGSQWMGSSTVTTIESGDVGPPEDIEDEYEVDGYGTLLLPGGISDDALRIRHTRTNNGELEYVSYLFWTNSGASLTVTATGGLNTPNSGMIEVEDITYSTNALPLITKDEFPAGFGILSTFPNPFTDQINLKINLPASNMATIAVHDITGKLVYSEVRPSQISGLIQWNLEMDDIPPGLYIATLQDNRFTQSIKLIKNN